MAIITISRGSYSRGKEVAEKVAHRLGYACISRDIVLDASEIFNVPELKLERAIHDAPSLLDRFSYGKERYIAYIQAALLKLFREDNVVYHGLAGHFFVQGIGHALKVRITADMEDRVRLETARKNISAKEALRLLKEDDEQRRRWSRWLYGIDTCDPSLYDLVLHLKHLTTDEAADIICHAVRLDRFRTTAESRQTMKDLALAAQVRAALVEKVPDINVSCDHGDIHIAAKANVLSQEKLTADLTVTAARVGGVKAVDVQVEPMILFDD
jgi:cytidylate kinase